MSAGEAIIFDDSLIHWSARNASDQPRVAIQALCVPRDATPVFFAKADDSRFELIRTDSEFFLTNGPSDLQTRQARWKGLGFVESLNRPISEEEFATLLARGESTRAAVYAGEVPLPPPWPTAAASGAAAVGYVVFSSAEADTTWRDWRPVGARLSVHHQRAEPDHQNHDGDAREEAAEQAAGRHDAAIDRIMRDDLRLEQNLARRRLARLRHEYIARSRG